MTCSQGELYSEWEVSDRLPCQAAKLAAGALWGESSMNRRLNWGKSIVLYALFTAGVTVLLLWLLFPRDFLRQWIPAYLSASLPQVTGKVGALELSMPCKLVLTDLEFHSFSTDQQLLRIERVDIQPDVSSLMKLELAVHFTARLYEGRVSGRVRFDSQDKRFSMVSGEMTATDLADVSFLRKTLDREVSGLASGQYSARINLEDKTVEGAQIDLEVKQGTVGLKEALLGHRELPFSRTFCQLSLRGALVEIENGVVESELLQGTFSGKIEPAAAFANALVNVTGSLRPRPEFFVHVQDQALLQTLRGRLNNEGVIFTVSGTVASPGLEMGELAPLLQAWQKRTEQ